jgi:hypothetical protein
LTIAESAGAQLQEKPQKLQHPKLYVLFQELQLNFIPSWCQSAEGQKLIANFFKKKLKHV